MSARRRDTNSIVDDMSTDTAPLPAKPKMAVAVITDWVRFLNECAVHSPSADAIRSVYWRRVEEMLRPSGLEY
jgi:hypothetical protein